jgi:hypothetical protein
MEFIWPYKANCVSISGSFCRWTSFYRLTKMSNDVWLIKLPINLDNFEYKFIVDGEWCHDNEKPTIDDGFNGKNNIYTKTS